MKIFKKIFASALCLMLIVSVFAGCSKAGEADKITDKTMLIAYTDEVEPFLYKDKNGKLTGFDVDLFKKIYDNVKNDTKNYEFVKVDKDYKVGDDVAYTDKDGNEYIAYTMIGAVKKNVGSVNEDFSFTNDIITDRIITVTKSGNNISDYNDLSGKKLAVVTDIAKAALDKNATIKNNNKNIVYPTIEDAVAALDRGSVDAVVTDEFSFSPLETAEKYQVLNGSLDEISYAFMFKKGDWVVDNWNEAIYELKSPEYNDKDEFTPMVEKYFGYNASSFNYVPSKTK
ncbi:MAG: transporter substrate-binding domain-containing protein [Eubacteriales bacterium]|nr:transporter substrate-binding domain-containing protein [Eubacteriales bacterium]